MPSERVQRQIDRLLDEAEASISSEDWPTVAARARSVLALDPENADARSYLEAAERVAADTDSVPATEPPVPAAPATFASSQPTSFANGRYAVKRFLGEGGKKKVYLAHDSQLDRDVAFALIKTEGLDDAGRIRIQREAQAMGRLGNHPNIVTVYDIGDENGQPFLVLPILSGGDVEGVVEKAPEHKLPLDQALKIAIETCQGLELAHSKGIVHRDLKPGNVWLTEDGRAMIGDFGLAVAMDRTRLTQAGMMVGTVSYMPPEQAMGGEITPRSDLYALGAMIYEMVCGRPPFVGDESVAIIGQHLNTPPVAPTWHRPDCPPALEALIMRLLEKDPGKRPASANEVREALQSVRSVPKAATLIEAASSTAHDPLYRRTFVGRENEVRQLQQAFDGAMSGNGALVMVVGEPGIGKTAICEQLATYVALRGGKALVGHCYEEGSLSLPYLAFVEAMRSYILAREPEGLRADLGTGAADVARIVSEVRDRVQGVELRPAGDPEDDRWRLLQSVTSFLRNASTVQPLVIVLEDLHWSDRGTLDLLLHVARNLQGARLLIVGTYRDVEVDRAHPLSGVLADLRRQGNFARVPLRGLTIDEVSRMYEAIRGQDVPWAQAEAVHRQTEGNPLFTQEVIRYMVEEGFVVRQGGRWVLAESTQPGTGLPEGLRDVVGKRLSRLSPECNRLLSVAAVIGRDFDLQTLGGIANLPEDDLYTTIEEAVKVGVLEERSLPGAVRYRFAHAFFRTSLYEEMIAPRRLRLHQEVARALEAQYASRREEHAAELAEHYGQSTDRADLAKAVDYSEMAAKRALSVFAYAEAESHLRRCLEVQEVLNPDDKVRRCELLLALAEARMPQDDPMRVVAEAAREAFVLAEELMDSTRAAAAAILACEAIYRTGSVGGSGEASLLHATWAARAYEHTLAGSAQRVFADLHMGMQAMISSRETGHEHWRDAVDQALVLGDNTVFYAAAGWAFRFLLPLRDRERVERLAAEMVKRPRDGARSRDLGSCLASAAWVLLRNGDRDGAEALWKELAILAEHSQETWLQALELAVPYSLACIDGRLEEAMSLYEANMALSQESGVRADVHALRLTLHLGRLTTEMVNSYEETSRPSKSTKAIALAYIGRLDEARIICQQFEGIGSEDDQTGSQILLNLFEAAILCSDRTLVEALAKRLAPLAGELFLGAGNQFGFSSMARHLAAAAVLLGRPNDARNYYAQGLEASAKIRFRPEIALIRLSLAELLLEHYPDERDAAIEHLDFAIAELRDMKMQPALERALRHRGLLKA